MTVRQTFLEAVGKTGMPPQVDASLTSTWEVYTSNAPKTDRTLSVLGFFHLLRQSGLTKHLDFKEKPEVVYRDMWLEDFKGLATDLSRLLAQYRIFDVLRVWKSKFSTVLPVRGTTKVFRLDLCLEPKKAEHLDSVLAKLQGTLYRDELPKALREVWKKTPVTSTAKPKSSLPKYTFFLGTDSTLSFHPLTVNTKQGYALFAARASGDLLLLRITIRLAADTPAWSTDRKNMDLLKSLLAGSLKKVNP